MGVLRSDALPQLGPGSRPATCRHTGLLERRRRADGSMWRNSFGFARARCAGPEQEAGRAPEHGQDVRAAKRQASSWSEQPADFLYGDVLLFGYMVACGIGGGPRSRCRRSSELRLIGGNSWIWKFARACCAPRWGGHPRREKEARVIEPPPAHAILAVSAGGLECGTPEPAPGPSRAGALETWPDHHPLYYVPDWHGYSNVRNPREHEE